MSELSVEINRGCWVEDPAALCGWELGWAVVVGGEWGRAPVFPQDSSLAMWGGLHPECCCPPRAAQASRAEPGQAPGLLRAPAGPAVQGSRAASAQRRVGKEGGKAGPKARLPEGPGTARHIMPVGSGCIHVPCQVMLWAEGHPQADWHKEERFMPGLCRPSTGVRTLRPRREPHGALGQSHAGRGRL